MAQHPGLPVHGYKPQSEAKVALVNEFKQDEERLLRKIEDLARYNELEKVTDDAGRFVDFKEGRLADPRWLAVARTHFEQGFMALNRAVFQPGRVALPEDAPAPQDEQP